MESDRQTDRKIVTGQAGRLEEDRQTDRKIVTSQAGRLGGRQTDR